MTTKPRIYHSDQLGSVTIPDDMLSVEDLADDDSLDTVEWLATLEMDGFIHGRNWLDKSTARVAFDDNQVIVYRFTNDKARLLEWMARFDQSVPASVIGAAIQAALQ